MTNVSQPPRSNFSARPSKLGFINNVNAGLILFTLSIIIISIFYGSILVVDHVLRFSEGKHLLVTNGNNNLLRGNSYSAESSISTASKSLLPNDSFHSTTFLSRQVGQIPKQGNHHNAYSHSISSVSTELDRKPIGFEDHNDFLKANEDSFLTLPSNLDKNVNILIGAWIYLDGERNDMRTIVSNKGSGCDNKDAQFGISLYVNGWASQDRRLYTEVGTKESGCYKLHSGSYMLELERWHHVAVYSANRSLALFLDGKVVALSEMKPSREPQLHRHLIAGQYDPASSSTSYPLFGRISRIVITSPKIPLLVVMEESNSYIEDVMAVPSTHTKLIDGVAFYPLNDAGALVDGSKATEVWKGFHGTYTFPSFLPGVSITGVKIPLVTGFKLSGATPSPPLNKQIYIARQAEIKKSTARVWAAYKRYAWGADELKPVSRSSSNTWGHMGMTLLDSLDTLWLLGLRKEFEEASTWVANTLIFQPPGAVSTFETTIRAFGGLLAAFDLSGQASLLERAKELGDFLFPAFDTESGVPFSQVIFSQRKGLDGWNGHNSLLAEMGTLQIEFRALSYFTGDDKYEKAAMRPIQLMASLKPPHGLYPLKISCKDGAFAEHRVTFGAMGDSFYEYLLKTWIQVYILPLVFILFVHSKLKFLLISILILHFDCIFTCLC